MKPKIPKRFLSLTFIFSILLFGYSNCAGPVSSTDNPYEASSLGSELLTVSPQAKTINWGEEVQFETTGGTEPYSYTLITGGGSLNPHTGLYIAPSYNTNVVVQIRDEDGNLAQSSAIVNFASNSAITMTYAPATLRVGDVATLTAAGGVAPYTFRIISGVGSISGNRYTASAFGTAVVGIIDANGKQNSKNINVSSTSNNVTVPVYKWYNSGSKRYYFSLTSTTSSGWANQGVAFKVLKSPALKTTVLLRCFIPSAGTHYLSSSGSCGTNQIHGTIGHVYVYNATNSAQLLHCFNNRTNSYLATTVNYDCINNGYSKLGAFGYVPR